MPLSVPMAMYVGCCSSFVLFWSLVGRGMQSLVFQVTLTGPLEGSAGGDRPVMCLAGQSGSVPGGCSGLGPPEQCVAYSESQHVCRHQAARVWHKQIARVWHKPFKLEAPGLGPPEQCVA